MLVETYWILIFSIVITINHEYIVNSLSVVQGWVDINRHEYGVVCHGEKKKVKT